jgi:hypothetical protein
MSQTDQTEPPQPTIVFVFELKQWLNQLSSLTKLELIDYIPNICTQFFFDPSIPAYVVTITKSKWDSLSAEAKFKFKTLTRRLREEVEGVMTQSQRDQYEQSDPFEAFAKKREEELAAQKAQAQLQAPVSQPQMASQPQLASQGMLAPQFMQQLSSTQPQQMHAQVPAQPQFQFQPLANQPIPENIDLTKITM